MPETYRPPHTPYAAVTALVAAVGFALVGGPRGILFGACVVVAWYALPTTLAFAVGQAAVPAAFSLADPLPLAGVELALAAVVALDGPANARSNALGALAGAIGVGLLVVGRRDLGWSLATLAVALALCAAVASYGLHRYSLVRLDLVAEVGR